MGAVIEIRIFVGYVSGPSDVIRPPQPEPRSIAEERAELERLLRLSSPSGRWGRS